jgi:hypothetical protein
MAWFFHLKKRILFDQGSTKILSMKNLLSIILAFVFMAGIQSCTEGYVVAEKPEAVAYTRPVAPGPDYVWINGDWVWVNHNYEWREGRWERPRQGKRWVDGNWEQVKHGYKWNHGYWK